MRAPRWWWTVVVVGGVATGVALRVWLLTGHLFVLDADEAIVGSMADHFRHGDLRAFYWGQDYGGSVEPLLTAVVFRLTGASVLGLKLVTAVLSAVASVLVWRVGRRVMDERVAQAAGLLFWVAPAAYVWWSTKARGFYWSTVVAGLVVVLAAQWIAAGMRPRRSWCVLGVAFGIGWWSSPAIAYFAVPVAAWLVARAPRSIVHAWAAVPAALAGSAPWIWHNLHHEWASFDRPAQPETVSYAGGIGRLLWRVLPMTLNLQRPFTQANLFPGAFPWVFLVAALATVVSLAVRRDRPEVVVAALVCLPFLYAAFPGAWFIGEARYAFFAAPFVALAVAWAVRAPGALAVLVPITALLSVVALRPLHMPSPTHLDADVAGLEAAGIEHVWLDYFLATRVTFESGERVVAASSFYVRFPPHHDEVLADPDAAYAFRAGDPKRAAFLASLDELGIGARQVRTRHLFVFVPDRPLTPDELPDAARP